MFRIIACVQIENFDAVKTVQFENQNYIGDPMNIIKILNKKGAQEILVVAINALAKKRIDLNFVSELAAESTVPFGFGGGLSVEIATEELTQIGVERFIVNSSFFTQQYYVQGLVMTLGRSSVSVSLDFKLINGELNFFLNGGRVNSNLTLDDLIKKIQIVNPGEIILRSIDNDGENVEDPMLCFVPVLDRLASSGISASTQILLSGGFRNIEAIQHIESLGVVDGIVLSSMVCYSSTSSKGILINYPKEYAVT